MQCYVKDILWYSHLTWETEIIVPNTAEAYKERKRKAAYNPEHYRISRHEDHSKAGFNNDSSDAYCHQPAGNRQPSKLHPKTFKTSNGSGKSKPSMSYPKKTLGLNFGEQQLKIPNDLDNNQSLGKSGHDCPSSAVTLNSAPKHLFKQSACQGIPNTRKNSKNSQPIAELTSSKWTNYVHSAMSPEEAKASTQEGASTRWHVKPQQHDGAHDSLILAWND